MYANATPSHEIHRHQHNLIKIKEPVKMRSKDCIVFCFRATLKLSQIVFTFYLSKSLRFQSKRRFRFLSKELVLIFSKVRKMKGNQKIGLPNMFKTRPKVQNEENYISSYVNVSFVHDDEIRRKSIELFYQMINHEIEHTSNIEHVSSNFVCTTGGSNRQTRTNYLWLYNCTKSQST